MTIKLEKQLEFIKELEKLKTIYRTNQVIDQSRAENSAEHSWHITVMALVFADYFSSRNFDLFKMIKMLLLHDIVEIDAGDVNLYKRNKAEIHQKEQQAAKRIFSLLPEKQKKEFYQLWQEFEEGISEEAKAANVIDSLQPLINHVISRSKGDRVLDIKHSEIMEKKRFIKDISPELWELALQYIHLGLEKDLYIEDLKDIN